MRKSGILMHITSLPGPNGIGTMGKSAYDFVDFLYESGQQCWQILPLTPTGYGDSPYQSCSAYAGNPYLIDLNALVQDGLLAEEDFSELDWSDSDTRVDFGKLYNHRLSVLRAAYGRFRDIDALDAYLEENQHWLPDFCLYMALKNEHGGTAWYTWPEALKFRKEQALADAKRRLSGEIRFYAFIQYLFDRQWSALRAYAAEKGIEIIGDVPIYVPYDSVEVWCQPELFQLDETLAPIAVAGCPPDYFSEDGQLWGNPLYRWDVHAKDGYAWWLRRLTAAGKRYDVVRLDHFRGFEAYWSVPYGDETAKNGQWIKGPAMDFVNALKTGLPELKFIAEDLGTLTQEVLDLRDDSGYPGMKVLGFAFDSREPSDYLPYTYTANSVCYTGTHDNMTTLQWLETAPADAVYYAREYLGLEPFSGLIDLGDLTWGMIRLAMSSTSDLTVIPMQDYLTLGGEARMNFPGTLSSLNWSWRAEAGYLSEDLKKQIYAMTKLYGRLSPDMLERERKALEKANEETVDPEDATDVEENFAEPPHEIGA